MYVRVTPLDLRTSVELDDPDDCTRFHLAADRGLDQSATDAALREHGLPRTALALGARAICGDDQGVLSRSTTDDERIPERDPLDDIVATGRQ